MELRKSEAKRLAPADWMQVCLFCTSKYVRLKHTCKFTAWKNTTRLSVQGAGDKGRRAKLELAQIVCTARSVRGIHTGLS